MGASAPIRQSVTVRRSPEHAFQLFTEGMGTWWPVESYSRAVSEFKDDGVHVERLEVQPRLRGLVLEHMSDGRVMHWAEVTGWDPPRTVVFSWRPHSMPEPPTELEVTFASQGPGTRVDLEHRGWERLSPQARDGLYEIYARGWAFTLDRFASAADQDG
jgi:uncharacterized protein YndB with AHSA1/START domain